MPLIGFSWTCSYCPAWEDGYEWDTDRDKALIQHAKRCRRTPSGAEVRRVRNGKLLYRKP
jgi:hypothetical protein